MITTNEISAVELSATKRDFYQIWNELLDTASKLSNRWDPTSTNEADPGIVLLKVLTAIADKLNYTIDKNTLEAFMPSATQEESMRKLCDMLGYTMKYYRSATCPVQISYVGTDYDLSADNCQIIIPQFSNIKNEDEDVNYVTCKQMVLGGDVSYDIVDAMEGEYVQYEAITRDQLDDNHRYYLPEAQIAENGIFLFSADDEKQEYTKVNNLNTQKLGTRCWKFGYDSKEDTPYIEFPADIDTLIGEGISFGYVRTNGANGNIAAGLLNKLDSSSCSMIESGTTEITCDDSWFSVTNTSAATNGDDKETLDAAYNAYKKTIGTFDTLVSCRDYMNKIYQLTEGDIDGTSSTTPLVSNIIASDIRDDINRGATVCSFCETGLTYNNQKRADTNKEFDNFDILLYPFKRVAGTNTQSEYINSFKYTNENLTEIKTGIDQNKTISHHILSPDSDEIACVKDLIKVRAKITTTTKVNSVGESSILNKVFTALYKNFNMRKVDFGEEISDEMIEKVILNADSRIKNVQLSTDHSLAFEEVNGTVEEASNNPNTESDYGKTFINLALLNVLAARIPLFNYNESFEPALNEQKSTKYSDVFYPTDTSAATQVVTRLVATYEPSFENNGEINVGENEIIQFRAPSFKTTVTYPAYVNYYIKLNDTSSTQSAAASFRSVADYMNAFLDGERNIDRFLEFVSATALSYTSKEVSQGTTFAQLSAKYLWIFRKADTGYVRIKTADEFDLQAGDPFYYIAMNAADQHNITAIYNFLKNETWHDAVNYDGVYKRTGPNTSYIIGELVDSYYYKYAETTVVPSGSASSTVDSTCSGWESLFIPYGDKDNEYGIGVSAELSGISTDQKYQLKDGEYLLINYTSTSTNDSGTESSTVLNKVYKNTVIKPSFELIDSATVHSQKSTSWSKKSGFNFSDENVTQPEGMFTLSANQQIEIIEPVIVSLGPKDTDDIESTVVNVYWVRNDDDLRTKIENGIKTLTFTWDSDNTYTLKEGEYFFYTNKNKTDLAYYGNGTKIQKIGNIDLVRDITAEESTSADEILQYGLAASIPWITKRLTKETNIKLYEYEYINVVTGQKIKNMTPQATLNAEWVDITTAQYGSDDDTLTTLQEIKIPDQSWQVRSLLQLNMGPKLAQNLSAADKIIAYRTDKIVEDDSGSKKINWKDFVDNWGDNWEEIETFTNIALKANVLIQSSATELIVDPNLSCQLKAIEIKSESDQLLNGLPIDFGNFGSNVTNVKLSNQSFPIYTCIPDKHCGLIMFYVAKVSAEPQVTLAATGGSIKHYNSDESDSTTMTLNAGLHILQIDHNCSQITISETKNVECSLIFSNLDIVPLASADILELNPKLGWAASEAAATKILEKLKEYSNFYYNAIIDSGTAIRFNDNEESDTLDNVEAWYDYNNVCNKFLIPELDASYFEKGIIIDKASKVK